MKNLIDFWKRNKKVLLPLTVAVMLSALTVTGALLTQHSVVDLESYKYTSLPLVIVSFVFIFAYAALCFVLRLRKKADFLKGLLLYQMLGLAAFVIHLILLMAEEESWLFIFFTKIFYWWTLPYHQGALWAIEIFHFPVRYVLILILAGLTYMTAKSSRGIRIDAAFEKKIRQQHEAEAKAEEEKTKHRIQTAKEVEDRNRLS